MTEDTQIIEKEGNKKYVMLPYEEYLRLREAKEDCEELRAFREAKELREESPWSGAGSYFRPGSAGLGRQDISSLAERWLRTCGTD